jgi:predicted TIM-barrel fold metal-dependent hydrolase
MDRISRRSLLAGLGAFGVGAALAPGVLRAQTPGGGARPQLIDVHHHILPPVYMAEARERVLALAQGRRIAPAVAEWTPQAALAEMDAHGVATAVVSISIPGVWFGNAQAARDLARKCNEYSAQLVDDHPGRFGFFAALPLPDTDASLRELDHALNALGADGVCLMTSYGDKWLGDPAFAPVLDELNRRKAVVYVHPNAPDCCRDLMDYVPAALTEFPHDTTRAVTSLLFSGSFARLREIRFIFSHAGGTLPMLAGRITRLGAALPDLAEKLPNGVDYELKRLHYEIANSANPPAIAALTQLVPTSQILFGSDYPYVPIGATAIGMTELGLSASALQAIGRDNALALLPRLGRPDISSTGGRS